MAIRSVGQIADKAIDTLNMWEHIAEGIKELRFLHENPKIIDGVLAKVKDAYKLTQDEIAERDAAVKTANDAHAATEKEKENLAKAVNDGQETIKQADKDAQKIRADADAYKKEQEGFIRKRWDALDTYKKELDDREEKVSGIEQESKDLAIEKNSFAEEKRQHLSDKKKWEEEFNRRFNLLSDLEKEKFRGAK